MKHLINQPKHACLARIAAGLSIMLSLLLSACGNAGDSLAGEWKCTDRHLFGDYDLTLKLNTDGSCRWELEYRTKASAITFGSSIEQIVMEGTWKQTDKGVDLDLDIVDWTKTQPAQFIPGFGKVKKEVKQIAFRKSEFRESLLLDKEGRLFETAIKIVENPDNASTSAAFDGTSQVLLPLVELSRDQPNS
jgi:hypothetical protein